jgi:phospholipid-binding lipoprotein MlaA
VSIVVSFRVAGRWLSVAALAVASLLGGCATPPTDPAERAQFVHNNDPLEPLNRKTFALNQVIDHALFKPAAQAYVAVFPNDARTAIHHMLDNMKEPTLAFNNLLQGEFKRAGISVGRLIVNSTVGFAGMVDVMTLSGVPREPADFGQTMYVWGIPSGPYLILPILGPTDARDAVGSAVDSYDDPFTIIANDHGVTELTTARFIVGGVEERAKVLDELDDLEKNSVDFYAQMRSLWQQHREGELHRGTAPSAAPGLYDDPGAGKAAPAPAKAPAAPAKPAASNPAASNTASMHMAMRAHTAVIAHTAMLGAARPHSVTHRPQPGPQKNVSVRPVTQCAAPRCAGRAA